MSSNQPQPVTRALGMRSAYPDGGSSLRDGVSGSLTTPFGRIVRILGILLILISPNEICGQSVQAVPEDGKLSFPYQAFVVRDGTPVFSGPGASHYATRELMAGELVEVHRHDPNDWCAIRPLADSFCLVPAEAIEVLDESTGKSKQDGVQVWVGTHLGPVENPLWQVKLKQGEPVAILGEISYPAAEGFSTTWLQIAPPAGEFRWIKRSDLLLPDPATQQIPEKPTGRTVAQSERMEAMTGGAVMDARDVAGSRTVRLAQATLQLDDPFASERTAINTGSPDNLGWRKATTPLLIREMDDASSAMRGESLNSGARFPVTGLAAATAGRAVPGLGGSGGFSSGGSGDWTMAQDAVVTPTVGNEPLTDRLRKIDMQLASEIIKPAELWNLNQFADQLVQVQGTAQTETERAHALKLINRIDSLRKTQQTLINTNPNPMRAAALANPGLGTERIGSGIDPNVQFGTTYDAYGWLNELVRNSGRDQATFVLQDENGKILYHIEPAPGLNLRRYLHTKVGVIGTRGFNQRLKLNHVTADRIVVLDKGDVNLR